jgi:hypothetical protein
LYGTGEPVAINLLSVHFEGREKVFAPVSSNVGDSLSGAFDDVQTAIFYPNLAFEIALRVLDLFGPHIEYIAGDSVDRFLP